MAGTVSREPAAASSVVAVSQSRANADVRVNRSTDRLSQLARAKKLAAQQAAAVEAELRLRARQDSAVVTVARAALTTAGGAVATRLRASLALALWNQGDREAARALAREAHAALGRTPNELALSRSLSPLTR